MIMGVAPLQMALHGPWQSSTGCQRRKLQGERTIAQGDRHATGRPGTMLRGCERCTRCPFRKSYASIFEPSKDVELGALSEHVEPSLPCAKELDHARSTCSPHHLGSRRTVPFGVDCTSPFHATSLGLSLSVHPTGCGVGLPVESSSGSRVAL